MITRRVCGTGARRTASNVPSCLPRLVRLLTEPLVEVGQLYQDFLLQAVAALNLDSHHALTALPMRPAACSSVTSRALAWLWPAGWQGGRVCGVRWGRA